MNYELAKKLKDAGFPHKWSNDFDNPEIQHGHPSDCKCLPTLSELIEACGESFHSLERFQNNWCAAGCHFPDIAKTLFANGSTPEIAVANLWLSLQQK